MASKKRKLKKSAVIYLTVASAALILSFASYGAFLAYRSASADVAIPGFVGEIFFYLQQILTILASWIPFAAMSFAVSRFMKHTAWRSVALFILSYLIFYVLIIAVEYGSNDFIGYMFSNIGRYTVEVFRYGYGFTLIANITYAVSSVAGALLARYLFVKRAGAVGGFKQDAAIMSAGVAFPTLVCVAEYTARFISASAFSASDFAGFAGDIGLVLLMNGLIPLGAGFLVIKSLSAIFKKT